MRIIFRFLLLSFFCISISSYSQDNNTIFYSVGFMSDYMGRRIEKGETEYKNSVDNFFHEDNFYDLLRLDTLLKIHNCGSDKITYEIKRVIGNPNCRDCNKFFNLNSDFLFNKINSFYSFKKNKLNSDSKIQRYNGKLKENKILLSSKVNQISFMAGAFYRYGDKDSIGYYFKFGNSIEKRRIVIKLLKSFDCKIISEFDNQVEGLAICPLIYTIYFVPSKDLKLRFDSELEIKQELKKTHANSKYK